MSLVKTEIRQHRPLPGVWKREGVHALGFVEDTFAILGEAMMRFLSMMEKRLPIQKATPAELTHAWRLDSAGRVLCSTSRASSNYNEDTGQHLQIS